MNWKNSIYFNTVKEKSFMAYTFLTPYSFNKKMEIGNCKKFQMIQTNALNSKSETASVSPSSSPSSPKVKKKVKKTIKKQDGDNLDPNNVSFKKFFNQCFDKGRLKNFVLWFLLNYGEHKTVTLVEQLKNVGFDYASKAGISLGIDDLKIPPKKAELIYDAEKQTSLTVSQYLRGEITGVERFQRLIDTWHRTSEVLKQEVIDHFEATDILNPVYMMAFSGARGNISQVRQLVGMRGLMADPQGQIIDFPIRSNFREGLTLTEYIISSYGARKGIVDTALRTANAGYLTRRLVDVAQHVIISNFDCGTRRGIFLINMKEGNKTIHSLSQRTVGRILARDLFLPNTQKNPNPLSPDFTNSVGDLLARRNDEVTLDLAFEIGKHFLKVFVRSPLTCETSNLICQLCYGWSLAQGNLVSIGEAVGVIAAQSIGEPGTQLTMRTFHTGGVFSGDVSDQIRAPFNGFVQFISAIPGTLIRTSEGKIVFLTKSEGSFVVSTSPLLQNEKTKEFTNLEKVPNDVKVSKRYKIPHFTLLYIRHGQSVSEKEVIAQISTISRKGNATDDAELTIKSDYEGQFYSKSLGFREKHIGPKIKLLPTSQSSKKQDNNLGEETSIQKTQTEKIYEAWTWGYAWILSGKIYESKFPSAFFAQVGDYLNLQSCLSQTKWKIPSKHGNNQKMKFEIPRKNFESNGFQLPQNAVITKNNTSLAFPGLKMSPTKRSIPFSSSSLPPSTKAAPENNGDVNIKTSTGKVNHHLGFVSKQQSILNLDLQKILYKKYGYVFSLTENIQFFKKTDRNSILQQLPLPLRFTEGVPLRGSGSKAKAKVVLTDNTLNMESNKKDLLFFMKDLKHSVSNLQKESPFILQWFPKTYQTLSGGFVLLDETPNSIISNSSYSSLLSLRLTEGVPQSGRGEEANRKVATGDKELGFSETEMDIDTNNSNLDKNYSLISLKKVEKKINSNSQERKKIVFNKFMDQVSLSSLASFEKEYSKTKKINLGGGFVNGVSVAVTVPSLPQVTEKGSYRGAVALPKQQKKRRSAFEGVTSSLLTPTFQNLNLLSKNERLSKILWFQSAFFKFNSNKSLKNKKQTIPSDSDSGRFASPKANATALPLSNVTSKFIFMHIDMQIPLFVLTNRQGLYKYINISSSSQKSEKNLKILAKFNSNLLTLTSNISNTSSSPTSVTNSVTALPPKGTFGERNGNTEEYVKQDHVFLKKTNKMKIKPMSSVIFNNKEKFVLVNKLKNNNKWTLNDFKKRDFFKNSSVINFNSFCKTFAFLNSNHSVPFNGTPTSSPWVKKKKQNGRHKKSLESLFVAQEAFILNDSLWKLSPLVKSGFGLVEEAKTNENGKTRQLFCELLSSEYLNTEYSKHSLIKNKNNYNKFIKLKSDHSSNILSLNTPWYLTKQKNIYLNQIYLDIALKQSFKVHLKNNNSLNYKTNIWSNASKINTYTPVFGTVKSGWMVVLPLCSTPPSSPSVYRPAFAKGEATFSSIISAHQTLMKPGSNSKKMIGFDFPYPVFAECMVISDIFNLKEIKNFKSLETKNLMEPESEGANKKNKENEEFSQQKEFEQYEKSSLKWKENKKCRYQLDNSIYSTKETRSNKRKQSYMGLYLQPVIEYNPINSKGLKQYVYETTSSILHNEVKNLSNNFKSSSFPKRSLGRTNSFLNKKDNLNAKNYIVNQSFDALYNWNNNKTSLLNKQIKNQRGFLKYPTQDFSVLLNSLDNQTFSFKQTLVHKYKKSDIKTSQSLTRFVNRKPFNFASFSICSLTSMNENLGTNATNDLSMDNTLMGINTLNNFALKYQAYSFSYQPLCRFDLSLYPFLSKSILDMLSFYLNKTTSSNYYNEFDFLTEGALLSPSVKQSGHSKESVVKAQVTPLVPSKEIFSKNLNDFILNLFERPCFSFNINERLNLSLLTPAKNSRKLESSNTMTKYLYNSKKTLISSQTFAKTNYLSPFKGELVYTRNRQLTNSSLTTWASSPSYSAGKLSETPENLPMNSTDYSCMFLTRSDLISYYLPTQNFKQMIDEVFNEANQQKYIIKDTFVKLVNMALLDLVPQSGNKASEETGNSKDQESSTLNAIKISKLKAGTPLASSLSLLGDFFVYGDPISTTTAIQNSGQIIHYNNNKVTLRRAQPIFISPKGILRKFDGDFIDPKAPVITLSYQRLKTGDIIQGIPKVEQFFESRTTKRGRLFRDSLPSLLKALFKRYLAKLPLDLAVRQSFYKIQQIVVDGVQRVYKSQGVTISDKHLEVIVKQMTSKVRILDGAQTGFFPGEVVDLCFVEKINSFLIKKITYEPLVLGITKASLEVDSFLSAASFQQTTRVLSKAAIYRKKDFLKGLKENVILGNLIPAGTGYLVYLDDFIKD